MLTEGQWITCAVDANYEIWDQYPHQVRKIGTGKLVKESMSNVGYVQMSLGGKTQLKHRVVAVQWVLRAENATDSKTRLEVDHIDKDKTNNRVENLRWVTRSENLKNRKPITRQADQYLTALPRTALKLGTYNGHKFSSYWFDYDVDRLIVNTRGKFKYVNVTKNGKIVTVSIHDDAGKSYCFSWSKLLREMYKKIE